MQNSGVNFMRTIPDPMRYTFGANQLLDFKVLMIIYSANWHLEYTTILRSARRIVYADL
jgi:hypothetical protein